MKVSARCAETLDEQNLKLFLNDLDKDFPRDERILWPDNEAYFGILERTLRKIGFALNLSDTPPDESNPAATGAHRG